MLSRCRRSSVFFAFAAFVCLLPSRPVLAQGSAPAPSVDSACAAGCQREYDRDVLIAADRLKRKAYYQGLASALCDTPWDSPSKNACIEVYRACFDPCGLYSTACKAPCIEALQTCCNATELRNATHGYEGCLQRCPKAAMGPPAAQVGTREVPTGGIDPRGTIPRPVTFYPPARDPLPPLGALPDDDQWWSDWGAYQMRWIAPESVRSGSSLVKAKWLFDKLAKDLDQVGVRQVADLMPATHGKCGDLASKLDFALRGAGLRSETFQLETKAVIDSHGAFVIVDDDGSAYVFDMWIAANGIPDHRFGAAGSSAWNAMPLDTWKGRMRDLGYRYIDEATVESINRASERAKTRHSPQQEP